MVNIANDAMGSRALSLGICMTALTAPLLAAYLEEIRGYHDSSEGAIAKGYILAAVILVALYLPAVLMIASGAASAGEVWHGTGIVLLALGVPYLGVVAYGTNNVLPLLLFVAGAVAAFLGVSAVNSNGDAPR